MHWGLGHPEPEPRTPWGPHHSTQFSLAGPQGHSTQGSQPGTLCWRLGSGRDRSLACAQRLGTRVLGPGEGLGVRDHYCLGHTAQATAKDDSHVAQRNRCAS